MIRGAKPTNNWDKRTRSMSSVIKARSSRIERRTVMRAGADVSDHPVDAARCAPRRCVSIVSVIAFVASLYVCGTASASSMQPVSPLGYAKSATARANGKASCAASVECCCPPSLHLRIDMARDDIPPLIRDLIYAERYRLLDDPVGEAVRHAISLGVDDAFVRSLL